MTLDSKVLLAAIQACVTVVGPDEVLAVRAPLSFTSEQFDELRRHAERVSEETGVRILFIAGEEFARVKAAAL